MSQSLAIELVAQSGISGNWLWWNFALGGLLTTFFFARLWRRSGVLTEVEFLEFRYSGKPAAVLLTLRNHVVGAEAFDAAFREYTRRWAFKHPTPADFFRTVENFTGEDLSWFWRTWFYETWKLDQAIDTVLTGAESRQALYVALSRGRAANHVYLATVGDGDPHSIVTPAAVSPPTATEPPGTQREPITRSA